MTGIFIMKNIVCIGNCQINYLVKYMQIYCRNTVIKRYNSADILDNKIDESLIDEADIIFSQPLHGDQFGKFSLKNLKNNDNCFFFSQISFIGFHQDCTKEHILKKICAQ